MNAEQAKKIQLSDLMAKLGYEVKAIERGRTEHKYLSPFRAEVEPSLNVNLTKNVFYDFGEGVGGDIIDFAKLYLRKSGQSDSTSNALQWLEDTMGRPQAKLNHSLSFSGQLFNEKETPKKLEFIKASPLQSRVILKYLSNRRISPQIAKKYLRVVQYRNNGLKPPHNEFWGFGQKNISDGWEVRSASDDKKGKFKSAIIVRDITVHPGSEQGRGAVSVFEGMLDHLSLLELIPVDQLRGDAIVMNALSSYNRTKAYIEEQGYTRIDLFLDNNSSGKKATAKFIEDFGDIVFDQSPLYLPHIDLNDCLRAGDTPSFEPSAHHPQP